MPPDGPTSTDTRMGERPLAREGAVKMAYRLRKAQGPGGRFFWEGAASHIAPTRCFNLPV
jgi:hypothetical protein